jgi:hypothetical protein
MNEREVLRAKSTELYQRLRSESSVPQALFELLDVILGRLDRIELGEFTDPSEVPTEPGKNLRSTPGMQAVREGQRGVGERVKKIFEDVKDPKEDEEKQKH